MGWKLGKFRQMKKLFKKHKIANKFLTWFLLVALLPFCVVGYITYRIYEKSLTERLFDNLIAIADNKASQIENYILEREKNVASLAHIPAIVDAAKEYEAAFIKKGKMPWRYSPEFIALNKKFLPFLKYYKETFGFSDLFLVSPHGDAVFSVMQGEDLGSNYYTGFYKDTELAKVCDRAKTLLETAVSDFEFYPATNQPAAFLAAPVLKEGVVVGVMVLQMSNEEVYKLAGDYTGLGETGETIIAAKAGDKAVFLTPLRHDPHAAFRRRVSIGSKEEIPIQEAVQGKKGFGKYIDYRGKEVLAAWRYLPHLRWGMAVEMDTEEVFTPIAKLRSSIAAIGSITIFMVILIAIYISRTISEPIVKLTETTRLIAGGDFSKSVTISSKDELGRLAGSFNEMVKNLADRTAEREQAVKTIKEKDKFIESMVQSSAIATFVIDAKHKVIFWNKACEDLTGIKSEDLMGTSDHWKAFYDHRRPCVADIIIDNKFNDIPNLYNIYAKSVLIPDGLYAEGWYPNLGGKNRYIAFDAAPICDSNGKLIAAVETLQDITERKQAEEELKKRLEELEIFYDATIGREGRIIELKQDVDKLLGQLGKEKKYDV
ncbi:MAG: HAMP domain-containing protein [Proteobacteria bacterium]|nr:HAMP domain-containing protein [Pseudomonadota bacterium]